MTASASSSLSLNWLGLHDSLGGGGGLIQARPGPGLIGPGWGVDTVHATYFTPRDASVRPAVESTPIRFGGRAAPSMWRAWLGFNISHGLGVFTVGLVLLSIALQNFKLVGELDAIQPLSIAFPAVYLVIALRFWFYGPVIVTAVSTGCFVVAAVLG